MNSLHAYGCSLTYGSEISGEGIQHLMPGDIRSPWPFFLSEKLGVTNTYNHARCGASTRDIALVALDNIVKFPEDIHVIGWTWSSRINFWPETDDSATQDQPNLILNTTMKDEQIKSLGGVYSDLFKNYVKVMGNREWLVQFLTYFNLVEAVAHKFGTKLIHVQIGNNPLSWKDGMQYINNQTIPHNYYNKQNTPTGAEVESKLIDHALYKTWQEADIIYRDGMYMHTLQNYDFDTHHNGVHWNKVGHQLVAELVYNNLKNKNAATI
ncbi:MAG: hypothetical protein ACON4I_11130 [Candidatus Puniceispirillaceae bacterium]